MNKPGINILVVGLVSGLLVFSFHTAQAQEDSAAANDVAVERVAHTNGSDNETISEHEEIHVSNGHDDSHSGIVITIDTDDIGGSVQNAKESLRVTIRDKVAEIMGDEAEFSEDWETFAEELDQLTPEQRQAVEDSLDLEDVVISLHGLDLDSDMDFDSTSAGEVLIATTAIVLSLGMPIIILLLVLLFSHRRRKQKMELVKTYLDANQEVPEHVLAEFDTGKSSHLSSGVKLLGAGIGIGLALLVLVGEDVAAIALIPIFIGLARLTLWKMEPVKE